MIELSACDLHIHTRGSHTSDHFILRKVGCPESYTDPKSLYRRLREKGMKFVTVTDHNVIEGALEIAHLDGAFISCEFTTYFPENGCKFHLLCYDITEAQYRDLNALRYSVYDTFRYVREHGIVHAVAHPLQNLNNKLDLATFEKLIVMFDNYEVLNGTRTRTDMIAVQRIVERLNADDPLFTGIIDRHDLGEFPIRRHKGITAGSDDHAGLYPALSYLEVPGAETVREFLAGLDAGKGKPIGDSGGPILHTHSIYAVAYQFISQMFVDSNTHVNKFLDRIFAPVDDAVLNRDGRMKRKKMFKSADPEGFKNSKKQRRGRMVKKMIGLFRPKKRSPLEMAARNVYFSDRHLFKLDSDAPDFHEKFYTLASKLFGEVTRLYYEKAAHRYAQRDLFGLLDVAKDLAVVGLLVSPYLWLPGVDIDFALLRTVDRQFGLGVADPAPRVAVFTDVVTGDLGVVRTLDEYRRQADANGHQLTIVGVSGRPVPNAKVFPALGKIDVRELEYPLGLPNLLDVFRWTEAQGFTHIHVATPGPMGLNGLLIARLMRIPVSTTQQAELPAVIAHVYDDAGLDLGTQAFLKWFYNRFDTVLVPSNAARRRLTDSGANLRRAAIERPLIDTTAFAPTKRLDSLAERGQWWARFGSDITRETKIAVAVSGGRGALLVAEAAARLERAMPGRVQLALLPATHLPSPSASGRANESAEVDAMMAQRSVIQLPATIDLPTALANADWVAIIDEPDPAPNRGQRLAIQAQAAGVPCIAMESTSAADVIVPGQTGAIVPDLTGNFGMGSTALVADGLADALATALAAVANEFDRAACVAHANTFRASEIFAEVWSAITGVDPNRTAEIAPFTLPTATGKTTAETESDEVAAASALTHSRDFRERVSHRLHAEADHAELK